MITLLTTRRTVSVQISVLLALVATAAPARGGPIGTLEELSPTPLSLVQDVDFSTFEGLAFFGAATGVLEAVELGTTSGCEASDFFAFTSGNIALIKRTFGVCTFSTKIANAAGAGALAALIFDDGGGGTGGFLPIASTIPALFLTEGAGNFFLTQMASGPVTVSVSVSPVAEPGSLILLGTGAVVMTRRIRRRRPARSRACSGLGMIRS